MTAPDQALAEGSNRPATIADVHAQCEVFAAGEGFPYFMFIFRIERQGVEPVQTLLTNYPRAWMDRYAELDYIRIDPVVAGVMAGVQPFAWSDLPKATPNVAKLFVEAASHGLAHGLTVPLHGPQGIYAAFSLVRPGELPRDHAKRALYGRVWLFAGGMFKLMRDLLMAASPTADGVKLTPRQREVTALAAQGLATKRIAKLIGISHRTVEDHLAIVLSKYKTTSREVAILRAVASGQIEMVAYPPELTGLTFYSDE